MPALDSIELGTRDGFDIRADMVDEDYYQPVPDGDCYTDEQIDAYVRGDWKYVGIIVTASRNGIVLGCDSVWSVDCGHMPGIGHVDPLRQEGGSLDTYRADMIDNAVADARLKLTELIDAAIDNSMGGN